MIEGFWKDKYPAGIAAEINPDEYQNIQTVLRESCQRFADKPAFSNLGKTLTYGELYELSGAFAAYLQQHTDLQPGDRIAVQLPNVLQYPIAVFGAIRAGLIVVNTNPLYTAREMEHQFNDSGAKALVCLANMAHLAEKVVPQTSVKHVIVTEVADMLSPFKRVLINSVIKYVKKMVPAYHLPQAIKFNDVLSKGQGQAVNEASPQSSDVAVLQYTGGTTGVAKGAMLTHRNMIANMQQAAAWVGDGVTLGEEIIITALPLYHIFALTANGLVFMKFGGLNHLITNPRDMPGFVKELGKVPFTAITGVNTLFNGLLNTPGFEQLDFSKLHLSLGGGMAVQRSVAERWKKTTGVTLVEAYGLTETSPAACINPLTLTEYNGSIGLPIPSTDACIKDDNSAILPLGEVGELCIKGPQVMKGYWQRPEATAEVLDEEGWFKTGDIAVIDPDGHVRIVDRKKDMIIVSGFNVYPNEIEDVVMAHPKVASCAAIGVPDEKSGEAVKLFVVAREGGVTVEEIKAYCKENFTGYKVPKHIVLKDALPMTPVGKILRRELRDIA